MSIEDEIARLERQRAVDTNTARRLAQLGLGAVATYRREVEALWQEIERVHLSRGLSLPEIRVTYQLWNEGGGLLRAKFRKRLKEETRGFPGLVVADWLAIAAPGILTSARPEGRQFWRNRGEVLPGVPRRLEEFDYRTDGGQLVIKMSSWYDGVESWNSASCTVEGPVMLDTSSPWLYTPSGNHRSPISLRRAVTLALGELII